MSGRVNVPCGHATTVANALIGWVSECECINVLRHMQRYFSYICDGKDVLAELEKKLYLRRGSQRHRHFVGFFNVPVQAPIRGLEVTVTGQGYECHSTFVRRRLHIYFKLTYVLGSKLMKYGSAIFCSIFKNVIFLKWRYLVHLETICVNLRANWLTSIHYVRRLPNY